ncbi:MAG: response regulator transcription factor [Chloroflexi bacterium]|nr:response regulator transcription factor [Chloroflexota bacterium]
MEKMRVLIADDHVIVREGLRSLLQAQPDIEVVGEAADGEEAVRKTEELQPDVVLMDITMPGMSGLEATRQIRKDNPNVKILVLTMHESDEYFFKMLDAGVSGYFVKGGSSNELLAALKTISQGDVYLYPTMAKKLLSDYLQRVRAGADKETYDGLTGRERQILKLIAEGRTTQDIADSLVLSGATVQTHRAHIMSKLGLRSRTELIKYAIKHGYVTLET